MELFKTYAPYIGSGIAACIGTAIFLRRWKHKKSERTPRVCGKDYPKDTVIVHDFAKGVFVPSIGHFVMKLETYLRMAKIPYEKSYDIGYTSYKGPKEKKPWIEYNGIVMGDSQQIINFLNKEFNVDLNKHLTPKERATSWAIQKWLEEFTYCSVEFVPWKTKRLSIGVLFDFINLTQVHNFTSRWCIFFDEYYDEHTNFPSSFKEPSRTKLRNMTYTVGVGRHSNEEVDEMFRHDLMMLSELLGDKKYLMGDQPVEVDCAAYGQLVQLLNTPDSIPGKLFMKENLPNLSAYCDRIKSLYWPDWDQYITGTPSH